MKWRKADPKDMHPLFLMGNGHYAKVSAYELIFQRCIVAKITSCRPHMYEYVKFEDARTQRSKNYWQVFIPRPEKGDYERKFFKYLKNAKRYAEQEVIKKYEVVE